MLPISWSNLEFITQPPQHLPRKCFVRMRQHTQGMGGTGPVSILQANAVDDEVIIEDEEENNAEEIVMLSKEELKKVYM